MKVTVRPREEGTHRFDYEFRWFSWALPLHIGIGTSWFPTETATIEIDDRWLTQRVLIIDILCFRCKVVLAGPLFTDREVGIVTDEGEIDG